MTNESTSKKTRVFLSGIGGSGMSTLGKLLQCRGYEVLGSDRDFDRGLRKNISAALQSYGIRIVPQDGSGIDKTISRTVYSTAVESKIPDIVVSKKLGIPLRHRAEELAEQLRNYQSVAIAGTSGKSTVTAMLAWILTRAGIDPTVIAGAGIPGLNPDDPASDFRFGKSKWAVFEADESDGSLVGFTPFLGLIHNIDEDHKPLPELISIFTTYSGRIKNTRIINVDCANTVSLPAPDIRTKTYGFDNPADYRGSAVENQGWESDFVITGLQQATAIHLTVPGQHNAVNALAAFTLARSMGIDAQDIARALQTFPGVKRRFERVGSHDGITVVDDFAHNPEKITASLRTAHSLADRLLVVYQPHGFGPTRFHFKSLIRVFSHGLTSRDKLLFTPIYYAGGTVRRDVSSRQLASEIRAHGIDVQVLERPKMPASLAKLAAPGTLILVMGARDPSLSDFCRNILDEIRRDRT